MGAFVRNDVAEIAADIDRVFTIFPRLKERRNQLAGTMSGGEQQMLAMGRALMARPKLLLLDEPSMGLSPIMVDKIFEVVDDIHARGHDDPAGRAEREPRAPARVARLRDGQRRGDDERRRQGAARRPEGARRLPGRVAARRPVAGARRAAPETRSAPAFRIRPHRDARCASTHSRARTREDWRHGPVQPSHPLPSRPAAESRLHCDVLVVGGGPAGSTIAALLAEQRPRRRRRREGAPPALSHRRVAAAGERRPCSTASACATGSRRSACPSTASSSSRPTTSTASSSSSPRPGTSRCRTPGRCAARELDETPLSQRRRQGRAHVRGPSRPRGRVRRRRRDRPGRARRRRAPHLARALRRRRLGPRHAARQPAALQGKEPAPQQLGAVRPLHRRRAAAGQARRQHHDLLVRARLVLVHPARRRHDQHRRGLLALLPEVAQQAAAGVLPRHDRALPGARAAPGRRDAGRRPRPRDRQLLVREREEQRRALPHARRRLRLRRPGVLVGRLPGDAERLRRRRRRRGRARPAGARPRRCGAASTASVRHGPREFSWFIFRVTNPTMREFFMSPQNPLPRQGSADLAARRRHLRPTPIWALDPRAEGALLPRLARQPAAARVRAWQRRRVNIRDVEAPAS